MASGWLCFCVSLGCIGVVTALIGDLATVLGLLIGLKDSVTAITLGTIPYRNICVARGLERMFLPPIQLIHGH